MARGRRALLLLDEPFRGIDLGRAADIGRRLRRSREGQATLVASADIDELLEVADRIVVLHDGAVVHDGHRRATTVSAASRLRRVAWRRPHDRRSTRSAARWLFALDRRCCSCSSRHAARVRLGANAFGILRASRS